MIAMIGTSDRLCWLAETCKILLLLLLLVAADHVSTAYAILQAVARHNATGATRVTGTKRFGAVQTS